MANQQDQDEQDNDEQQDHDEPSTQNLAFLLKYPEITTHAPTAEWSAAATAKTLYEESLVKKQRIQDAFVQGVATITKIIVTQTTLGYSDTPQMSVPYVRYNVQEDTQDIQTEIMRRLKEYFEDLHYTALIMEDHDRRGFSGEDKLRIYIRWNN